MTTPAYRDPMNERFESPPHESADPMSRGDGSQPHVTEEGTDLMHYRIGTEPHAPADPMEATFGGEPHGADNRGPMAGRLGDGPMEGALGDVPMNRLDLAALDPSKYECGHCGAEPGQPCRRTSGSTAGQLAEHPHSQRNASAAVEASGMSYDPQVDSLGRVVHHHNRHGL